MTSLTKSFVFFLTFEQKIEKKNIEIIGLEDLQPQYIVADPDMIYQVIYNLFDNAVKFTNEDGFIKVTLEDLGSQIRVSIKNSGMPALRPRSCPACLSASIKWTNPAAWTPRACRTGIIYRKNDGGNALRQNLCQE